MAAMKDHRALAGGECPEAPEVAVIYLRKGTKLCAASVGGLISIVT